MPERLTAELLFDSLTDAERERARRVDGVLPELRAHAAEADARAEFHRPHVKTLAEAGLLGLVVPERFGGLGGGLRDLTAATFAMGTACPSTALAYFFHCSSASRGLLGLEAVEAGLFDDAEAPVVTAFAERVLRAMGQERRWTANFASESVKTSQASISIATEARPTDGGWLLTGEKSFGCATGVADLYLVTARLAGSATAEGLAVFLVRSDAEGIRERQAWDGIGMRATANHGVVLQDVFVPADAALGLPGAFVKMMQMSRGTFVGNQAAGTAVYVGAAQSVFDAAVGTLQKRTLADTGQPLATTPLHQHYLGEMAMNLETSYLWLRRQVELEAAPEPLRPKTEVVKQWRLGKGSICESAFAVAVSALKACGTSMTANSGPVARGMRDLTMGLVQAFPAEKGRLEAAHIVATDAPAAWFAGAPSAG
jgi:alkylation response protein AidB-like acyl-CoA dehydrogenase